jgi:hypothetical protein
MPSSRKLLFGNIEDAGPACPIKIAGFEKHRTSFSMLQRVNPKIYFYGR